MRDQVQVPDSGGKRARKRRQASTAMISGGRPLIHITPPGMIRNQYGAPAWRELPQRVGITVMDTDPPKARAKPGPKSKGDRTATSVRLPNDLWRFVDEDSERDNLPMTSVITRFVAEEYGRPVPAYCLPQPHIVVARLRPVNPATQGPGRTLVPVYLPNDLRKLVLQDSRRGGIAVNSVMVAIVAKRYQQPVPSNCLPKQRSVGQQSLLDDQDTTATTAQKERRLAG